MTVGPSDVLTGFRALNARIRLLVEPFDPNAEQATVFVCECVDEYCFAPVEASAAEFDAIRSGEGQRLIAPGHEVEGEHVVVETRAFAVVRPARPGEAAWLTWAAVAAEG